MDVYIKPRSKVFLTRKQAVTIKDVAEVEAPGKVIGKIMASRVMSVKAEKKREYVISVIDIIRAVKRACPDASVNNVGETDLIISYDPEKRQRPAIITGLMVAFVTLVLLMGSATAIMSFHSDSQIPKVFQNYYKIFFGKESEKPLIIDIPYSIGLACGIIIFFNHFLGKKLTAEPTPIEVEMTAYENEVNEAVIDRLTEQKTKKEDEDA